MVGTLENEDNSAVCAIGICHHKNLNDCGVLLLYVVGYMEKRRLKAAVEIILLSMDTAAGLAAKKIEQEIIRIGKPRWSWRHTLGREAGTKKPLLWKRTQPDFPICCKVQVFTICFPVTSLIQGAWNFRLCQDVICWAIFRKSHILP